MEKLKMQSGNLVEAHVEKIAKLFPHCVKNGKVDFDLLRQELSSMLVEGKDERYRLDWIGKRQSILTANSPTTKTVRLCRDESVDFDNTKNIYIKGDNLDGLKLISQTYIGKIKMIYIDPPYNTGTDTLPYYDDFTDGKDEYLEKSGQVVEGVRMVVNSTDNGKYHTNWLNVLYSRLRIAKTLLADDGVIFISIDDNEAGNMKSICDEIFNADNYLETFFVQVRYEEKSLNEKDNFQKLIEQVFIYAKDKKKFIPNKPFEEYDLEKFCWDITTTGEGQEMVLGGKKVWLYKSGEYEIKAVPASINALKETWASGSVLKGNTSGKFFDKQLSTRIDKDGLSCLYKVEGIGEDGIGYRFFTGPKKQGATKGKFYSGVPLDRREELKTGSSRKYKPIPNFYDYSGDFGNIGHEGGVGFRGGKKPVKMLLDFINIANVKDGEIVLDFFSGSASTAHAVLRYNSQHNRKASYMMMQIPELFKPDSDYYKAGFKNICELALKRIRNASAEESGESRDVGVRVFQIDSSNMSEVFYNPKEYNQSMIIGLDSSIKDDRTAEDILFQVMLGKGVSLASKIEKKTTANGKQTYYIVGEQGFGLIDLICCLDKKVDTEAVKEIAKLNAECVVFLDSGMENDATRTNVQQIFDTYSPKTMVEVL